MKLELKHLSSYFPYGLKVRFDTEKYKDTHQHDLVGLDLDSSVKVKTHIGIVVGFSKIDRIKPILRPLSDLQKLIVEEFEKYDGLRYGKPNHKIINLFCEENGYYGDVVNIDLTRLPYECAIYIFENHYDFFGLIDKGLAIDINSLN
jgi:hypothetical protein